MAVVFTDTFTVAVNEDLRDRTGWAQIRRTEDAVVNAANDRVEIADQGATSSAAWRITDAAAPTGDQQITITANDVGANNYDCIGAIVRADASPNFYFFRRINSTQVEIFKFHSSGIVQLAQFARSTSGTATHTIIFKAQTVAGDVVLTASIDGTADCVYTDTADQILSGTPGIGFASDYACWVDDVSVDDLAGASPVSPGAIASLESFGAARIAQQIRATSLASAESFGSARLSRTIRPSSLSSAEVFGSARLNLIVRLTGLASGESFGTQRITRQIRADGLASGEAFGNHIVSSGDLILIPTAIASVEALGAGTIARQIRAQAIATAESFGTARFVLFVRSSGLASGELFGAPVLVPGPVTLVVTGIAAQSGVGSPVVLFTVVGEPRALFHATGRTFLIDASGRVFEVSATARPFTFH